MNINSRGPQYVEFLERNEKSNRYFFNKEKEPFDKKTVEQ